MKTLVVDVNILHDNADGPGDAVVELTPELLETIKVHRAILAELKDKRQSASSITSWDSSATFVSFIDDELEGKPRPVEWEHPDADVYNAENTECDELVVTDTGVYWTSLLKHSEVRVETKELSWEQLGLT